MSFRPGSNPNHRSHQMAKARPHHSTPRRTATIRWRRATRIRIKMIAQERGLSDAEISKALNCGTAAILAFAYKHNINLDWLVCGDLRGLLETARGCPSRPRHYPADGEGAA